MILKYVCTLIPTLCAPCMPAHLSQNTKHVSENVSYNVEMLKEITPNSLKSNNFNTF